MEFRINLQLKVTRRHQHFIEKVKQNFNPNQYANNPMTQ